MAPLCTCEAKNHVHQAEGDLPAFYKVWPIALGLVNAGNLKWPMHTYVAIVVCWVNATRKIRIKLAKQFLQMAQEWPSFLYNIVQLKGELRACLGPFNQPILKLHRMNRQGTCSTRSALPAAGTPEAQLQPRNHAGIDSIKLQPSRVENLLYWNILDGCNPN